MTSGFWSSDALLFVPVIFLFWKIHKAASSFSVCLALMALHRRVIKPSTRTLRAKTKTECLSVFSPHFPPYSFDSVTFLR